MVVLSFFNARDSRIRASKDHLKLIQTYIRHENPAYNRSRNIFQHNIVNIRANRSRIFSQKRCITRSRHALSETYLTNIVSFTYFLF